MPTVLKSPPRAMQLTNEKVKPQHVSRKGILYVRQSSAYLVSHNLESQRILCGR